MERSEAQFEAAHLAYESAVWQPSQTHSAWDGYWFAEEGRLELYWRGHNRGQREFDFSHLNGAVSLILTMEPRLGEPQTPSPKNMLLRANRDLREFVLISRVAGRLELSLLDTDRSCGITFEGGKRTDPKAKPLDIRVEHAQPRWLRVVDVDLRLVGNGEPVDRAELQKARLDVQRPLQSARVSGNCQISTDGHSPIETLELAHGSTIRIGDGGGRGSSSIELLKVEAQHSGYEIGSASISGSLDVAQTHNARLTLKRGASLVIRDRTENLYLTGDGRLEIQGVAENITFGGDDQMAPLLNLAGAAVLQHARGIVRLGVCRDAQINGDPVEGVKVITIESAQDDPVSPVLGLLIRSFTTPVTLIGLQILSALEVSASVAVPMLTSELPGHRRERKAAKSLPRITQELRADFASSLARLAERRGAPGSVRTRLAWQAYRMRQSTALGIVERATLAAYRIIGYGERAGPPALAYLALAVGLTPLWLVSHGSGELNVSLDGFRRFIEVCSYWIATPLHVLRLGDAGDGPLGSGNGVLFGRVLIAIPFVTAVLAFRKYVKRTEGE